MAKQQKQSKQNKIRLFISYSRRDFGKIEKLYEALSGDDELDVYLDQHDIAAAEDWKQRLDGLIRSSDTILFAVSRDSVASDICQWEIDLATQLNKRIIPVIINDVADEDVPEEIARLNYVFARTDKELIPALQSIGDALKIDIDWIREHTRLADMAHRWEQASKLGAQPLRGKELEAAEQWLSSQPKDAPAPTELQRKYIYESRKSATKRQRMTVMGSIAAMLIVGVLAGFAFVQRNAAIEGERKAEAALRSATEAANTMTIEIAQGFHNSRVPVSVIKNVIEKSLNLNRKLSSDFEDSEELKRSELVAETLFASKSIQEGEPQKALEHAKRAVFLADGLFKKNSSIKNENNLANALKVSHEAHVQSYGYGNNIELISRAFLHSKNIKDISSDFRYKENFAAIASDFGRAQYQSGNTEKAIELYQDALSVLEQLSTKSNNSLFQEMSILERWGVTLPNSETKIQKFRRALDIIRKLREDDSLNIRYLYAEGVLYQKIGLVQLNIGAPMEGAKMMFNSHLMASKLFSLDATGEHRRNLTFALSYMGDAIRAGGKAAEKQYGRASTFYINAFTSMKLLSMEKKESLSFATEYVTIVSDYIDFGAETLGYQLGGISDLKDYVLSLSKVKALPDYSGILSHCNQLEQEQKGIELFTLLKKTIGRLSEY